MTNSNEVKYFWLRDKNRNPVGCIVSRMAYVVPNSVEFAVSTYNPHDKFSKVEGRKQALAKLEAGQGLFADAYSGDTKSAIFQTILDYPAANTTTTVKWAKYQLEQRQKQKQEEMQQFVRALYSQLTGVYSGQYYGPFETY